jgi:hypothetical protein
MKQYWPLVLICSIISFKTVAQINQQEMSAYVDTSSACSFFLPRWFTVKPSSEYRDVLEVWESNEFSFKFSSTDWSQENYEYERYVGTLTKDSSDAFLRTVKQETFFSGAVNYHGLAQYARLDSLKEYKSVAGLRVVATYRTKVSLDGIPIDNEKLGPLYFVDTSQLGGKKILMFDFSWFDTANEVYNKLALLIVLSVRPK